MTLDAQILNGMAEIPADVWDQLSVAGSGSEPGLVAVNDRPADPFTTHRFLLALDKSHSTGPGTGWQPQPLVLKQAGVIVAAVPLYLKSHSQGEYIFDHGWAEALNRAGGNYYPKLQVAVPFTPATGPRFLGPPKYHAALMDALINVTEQNQLSSLHVTFCTKSEADAFATHPQVLQRITQQFHWENRGYSDFDGFLQDLSSRKRKMIRKERQTAQSSGLTIKVLTGDQIEPSHWDAFWRFYQDTGNRKWGTPYLTRVFFDEVQAHMRKDVLLVMAFDQTRPVAAALNFIGQDTLFGRYWGCVEDHPCLHFELCYYQAIDWAIAHGLSRVEAGAQGEHKLARGYLPTPVHSLHWIADPGFRNAVDRYLQSERRAVDEEINALTAYGPFRKAETEDET